MASFWTVATMLFTFAVLASVAFALYRIATAGKRDERFRHQH
jgi:hypothetical protein